MESKSEIKVTIDAVTFISFSLVAGNKSIIIIPKMGANSIDVNIGNSIYIPPKIGAASQRIIKAIAMKKIKA